MKTIYFCLFALLPGMALVADKQDDLMRRVGAANAAYSTFAESPESKALARQGQMDELNQKLLHRVPDEKKTVVDYFVLGNMLYDNDRESSYQMIAQALKLSPDEPAIQYEMALQEHRKGNCAKAVSFYEKVAGSAIGEMNPAMYALMADCYLRIGAYPKAFASWKKAGHAEHHTSIDFAIHSVYGREQPLIKRAQLLKAIRGGARNLYGDLILYDAQWQTDWWNVKENTDFLNYDMSLAEKDLGKDDPRFLELKLFLAMLKHEVKTPEEAVGKLKSLGLWGEKPRLPFYPRALYHFVKRLNEDKSATSKEMLTAYEASLRERALGPAGHEADLDVLAFLYADTENPKLNEVDRLGWKTHHLVKFARSYLAGLGTKNPDFDKELNAAVADFPNSVDLAQLHLSRVYDTDRKIPAMAAFAAAGFPGVEQEGGSYRLKSLILSFEFELEKAASAKSK